MGVVIASVLSGVGVAAPAVAEYATGGSGRHKASIDWFEWGAAGQDVTSGTTRTNTRTVNGVPLSTTCTITNVQGVVETYRSGTYVGDGLDNLYNVGGPGTANTLVTGLANRVPATTVNFSFACSTTLGGVPVPLQGLVIADAEASSQSQGEYVQAKPDQAGSTWRVIDRYRDSGTISTTAVVSADGTLRLTPDGDPADPRSGRGFPMAVAFMDGATSAQVELRGGGNSAIALGVVLSTDFGDAPASYGEAGALFEPTWSGGTVPVGTTPVSNSNFALATTAAPVTRLGALTDAEVDQLYSADATGDNTVDTNDEDSISPPAEINVTPGSTYTLPSVACTGPGFVTGWIDWNHNGAFDTGEASASVECVGGAAALSWTVPADAVSASTFLRLRIAADQAQSALPVGLATSGEVEDYAVNVFVPTPAYTVAKSASVATVNPGGQVTYTVTVTNTGNVDYTAASPASFSDDLSAVLDDATYNGDASGGATVAGNTLSWSGPLAVGASTTITYSVTVKDPDTGDNLLTNTVVPTDPTGTCETPDGCTTNTPVQSLVMTKTADTNEVVPGDTITYTITVQNTGQAAYTAADPASFTDDLSAVLDDATYNNDATSGATYAAPTLSWSGPLAVDETVTVTYTVTVNDPVTGDSVLTNAIVSDTPGGNCPPGSTDPDCVVEIPSGSFTVAKSSSTAVASPGDTVTYTVTVTNTGAIDYTAADPASFSDDLSAVLDDATYNNDASNGATVSGNTLSWSGPLAVGASTTITYSVNVNDPTTGDKMLTNTVRPTSPGGDCETPEGCTTDTPVRTYTTAKTSDPSGAVTAGTVITYTVTVTNTGQADYTTAVPASFTDDLSAVLDDATYNNDASNGATVSGNTLSWSGPLAVGASTTITYSVTVAAAGTGDGTLTNAVVPTGPGGDCVTPDGCTTTNPVQSYTTAKTSAPAGAVNPGSTVTYTVTVTNTGNVDYTAEAPASFTDDLTAVLDDATYNNDATGGATVSGNTLSWSGPLAVGESTTITYTVTVNDPDAGDHTLTNAVVPTGPGGDCETEGGCVTTNPVQSYTTAKSVSATKASPGDVVTYTITVTNTGQVDYTEDAPATFTDDLTAVLDDATYNNDAANGATVNGVTLSWAGALEVGQTITVTYSVTVNNPDNGDHSLDNTVTPTGPGGGCDPEGECATITPIQSYTTTKTADRTEVVPGDTITYTITVVNTGQVDYTEDAPATFTDDLSGVLDDATYNNDATSGATYTAPTLSWSGPLAIGATVTVTYSVTVNDPTTGDSVLPNAVVTGTGGNCPPGSTDPACVVEIPSGSFTVVKSADKTVVDQGGTITYTVTVTNTGQIDYTDAEPASFADDLSAVLDDATYNDDATNGATVTGTTLAWSGPLAVGATATITYSVTVNNPAAGDKVLNNFVRPTSPGGTCETEGGCATTTPVRSLEVSKTVDSKSTAPGKKLTYTITITNTGTADYTTASPATFTDDLSAVIDDATYNGDATGGASYAAPVLSWKGALTVGASQAVTYSVTVNNPDTGDHVLRNAVVTPGSNCVAGSSDPACTVTTTVPKPPLASTGVGSWLGVAGIGGLLAILLGLGVTFIRRRQTNDVA